MRASARLCQPLPFLFLAALLATALPAAGGEGCTACHLEAARFSPFHDPAAMGCVSCHGGVPEAGEKQAAHAGIEPYPGRAATAFAACGKSGCHPDQVGAMLGSVMTTANGLIELTRKGFGLPPEPGRGRWPAQRLGTDGVDSYLRKLCVSCHLANDRRHHGQSLLDRGGGCAACHLQVHPQPAGLPAPAPPTGAGREIRSGVHPTLTLKIPNERCFGCHSRSGRIAMNYVGLAEVERADPQRPGDFGHLADGRLVEKVTPDLHSEAGLSCIDCHTATGVMGTGGLANRQREQLDIQCQDCHAATLREKPLATLTPRERLYPRLYGWPAAEALPPAVVVTERRGTPLWNLRREGGKRILRKKVFGTEVAIPTTRPGPHHDQPGHERLTCAACHDTWAPQCDGCHISFDPARPQLDHTLGRETAGRWVERRWSVRHGPPALGVTGKGKVAPFVPGMSLIADLPGRAEPVRRVRYARIAPHTTRRAGRDCASCHNSPAALGLVTGIAVHPDHPAWRLPVGWVKAGEEGGDALHAGDRPLTRAERARIRRVGECLSCHRAGSRIYQDFPAARRAIAGQKPHPAPGSTAPAP